MKQHITPKQAQQLTEQQFYSLFNDIVERSDWAHYHHKKATIGKLIEVLDEVAIKKAPTGDLWDIAVSNRQPVNYQGKQLVDALWCAVVDRFTQTERSHPA